MRSLAIAWRNIMRKPRRTAVTVAAVALNTAVLVFTYAMMDGMIAQLVHSSRHTYVGDVQLHAPGYRADRSIYKSLPEPQSLLDRAAAAGFGAAARSFGFGLASCGAKSAGASYWGIDPAAESSTFEMAGQLRQGRFLSARARSEVVIGRRLARSLQADVGSEIVAVVQAADGSLGNDLFRVAGILQSVGEEIDRGGILMHREDFDRLFVAAGRVHEVALLGHGRAAEEVAALYAGPEEEGAALVAETWRELLPTLSDMLNVSGASMGIFSVVFLLAAGLGVLNTMFMATHDRVREFGMLKALGTRPRRIVGDVLVEALVLSGAAALIGAGLGSGVSLYLEVAGGLDLTRWQGESLTMSGMPIAAVYQFSLHPARVATAVVSMSAVCAAAALFPALKAARLDPVAAMTHQ